MGSSFSQFGTKDKAFLFAVSAGIVSLFTRLIFFDIIHGNESFFTTFACVFYYIPSFYDRRKKAITHSLALILGLIGSIYYPMITSCLLVSFFYIQLENRTGLSYFCLIYILVFAIWCVYRKDVHGSLYVLLANFIIQKGTISILRSAQELSEPEKPKKE